MEGHRSAAEQVVTAILNRAQIDIALAIRSQGLVHIDLTIPAQRTIANKIRTDLGLPSVGEAHTIVGTSDMVHATSKEMYNG